MFLICGTLAMLGNPRKGFDIQQKGKSPNVIIIMTDDQGYPELSIHGNPLLRTPNLDELARKSVRFGDFHVSPMCAPTRGQLLTGMDAVKNGTVNVSSGRGLLDPNMLTIGDIFTANGYRTGIFGKWHNGENYPFRPEDRGFQQTVWFPSSHIGSVPDYWGNDYFDDSYWNNGKRKKFEGYCTDIFFDEAMKFIELSVQEGKPFFTFLPTNTPHGPFIAKEEDLMAIEKAYENSPFADDKQLGKRLIPYLAMIRNIDSNIGRLFNFLEKNELRDDTIVIFLTDNGSIMGTRYFNANMRGMKTELWDGGHRVPFFISWPNGNFKAKSGIEIEGLTEVQDILPTLVELCSLNKPIPLDFDGTSLVPVLRGEQNISEDRMLVINYSRMPGGFNYPSPFGQSIVRKNGAAVLWKGWRMLESRELYNRENDPLQQNNVYDQNPKVVAKMQDHLDNWWDGVKDKVNIPHRIIIGNENANPVMLTACDWLDVFVDQQSQIRRGVRKNGYWSLDVDKEGEYEFELRRWPREVDAAISAGIPKHRNTTSKRNNVGVALPIVTAKIYIGGVNLRTVAEKKPYGFEGLVKQVSPDDKFVTFNIRLKPGSIYLHTFFDDKAGENVCGAYYVYVKRK